MVDLLEGERVIFRVRRHMFVFYARSFFIFLVTVLPLFAFGVAHALFGLDVSTKLTELLWFGYATFLLIIWNWFFMEWTDYYLDSWIMTDKRLIDVDQRGLFHRKVSSLALQNIQDIKVETKGLIATFLKFGDIHVQTAGTDKEFIIREAYNPTKVKNQIAEVHQRIVGNGEQKNTELIQ